MKPHISVVIPAYNEEENLRPTIESVRAKLDELETTFEIIIVNDGSADRTQEIAEQICEDDGRARLINHPCNIGPGSGVFTGIEAAAGEFVIFIPADLALEPDDLGKYIETSRDCDLVVGIRSDRRDYSPFRKIVSYVNIFLMASIPAGYTISSRKMEAIDAGDSFSKKFEQYQSAMIIRLAMIEGTAVFSLVGRASPAAHQ